MPTQRGKHLGDWHAIFFARGDAVQCDVRMRRKQSKQLNACVASAADDTNLDHS
jgi:hypothetical protein